MSRAMRGLVVGLAALAGASAAPARLGTLSVQAVTLPGSVINGTAMAQDPLDPGTIYAVQQNGHVKIIKNGVMLVQEFANLQPIVKSNTLEEGLLGMTFSPNFATDRRVFFNFNSNQVVPAGQMTPPLGATIVARFLVPAPAIAGDPLAIDFNSRFDLDFNFDLGTPGLRWIQQFSNHKGGNLGFDSDGYFFMGMGDGGGQSDPNNRGQTPTVLLGKILRIDVRVPDNDPVGFVIPPSNPFLPGNNPPTLDPFYGAALARPHIWAFGVRNPWKWTFDSFFPQGLPDTIRTNDFFLADVGQNAWEEVDRAPHTQGGINWGWRWKEGTHAFNQSLPMAYGPLKDPIIEYPHATGLSITGGFVYRGKQMCSFQGRYIYADFQFGRMFSANLDGTDVRDHTVEMFGGPNQVLTSAFGRDADGEIYIVKFSSGSGQILKIVSNDAPLPGDVNGDRLVNFADLNFVLSSFGTTYNFARLNQVLSEFGQSCN